MSRNDGLSNRLRRRPSRTIPALITGFLLLASSVFLAWLAIARLVDGTWPMILQEPRNWLTALSWESPAMWGIAVATIAAGLVLLLCALIPGAFSVLMIRNAARTDTADTNDSESPSAPQDLVPGTYEREIVMTRRAVAHVARAQCLQVDGVTTASTLADNKRVHLKVRTSLRETQGLRTRVIDTVRQRLTTIGLDPMPRITATVETIE